MGSEQILWGPQGQIREQGEENTGREKGLPPRLCLLRKNHTSEMVEEKHKMFPSH